MIDTVGWFCVVGVSFYLYYRLWKYSRDGEEYTRRMSE